MRKFLVGAILGALVADNAGASIISRSFLDQALTDYATNTALDLKADKADVTDLSDKIGDDWPFNSDIMPGLYYLVSEFYPQEISLKNTSDLAHFLFGGALESGLYANAAGVLNFLGEKVINVGDYEFLSDKVLDRFRSLTQLTNGWTDSNDGTTYLGVKDINTKIGTLPSGYIPDFPGYELLFPGLNQPLTYPTSLAELITAIYGNSETGKRGLLSDIIAGFGIDTDGDGQFDSNIGTLSNYGLAKEANDLANANATKIGDLPTEIVIGNSTGSIDMFNITKLQSVSLPKDYTLSDFIQDMYYGSFGVSAGLDSSPFYGLSDIIDHVMYGGITGEASPLTDKQYKGLIDLTLEINKIGTLPSGSLLNVWGGRTDKLYKNAQATDTPVYPTSLEEFVQQIYGIPGAPLGVIPSLVSYINDSQTTANTAKETANAAKTAADSAVEKIGTLPTEYATVGAALTAIKGIAEEAKAAAVAAIPDPKTEGSTGKFVLTVDIVGDNATYRWEKIDREDETTTTTE